MGRMWIGLAAGCLLGAAASSGYAQGARTSAQLQLAKQAEKLKPGQWVWAPKIAPKGPILVYVDLDRQVATVYRNGIRIGVTTISSGKPGYDTPTGVFTILEKNVVHHSSKYNNASMPYQQRLTTYGVALHAGGLPGYPESHGCVHLPIAFSRLLYDAMPKGGTVIIAGKHGDPYKRPAAGVLAPALTGAFLPRRCRLRRTRITAGIRSARPAARCRSSSRPATSRWSCCATESRSDAQRPRSSSR